MDNHPVRILCLIVALIALPGVSFGHSPHHIITDVASTTSASSDSDVFILITDQIFRSDSEGSSWKNLTNGLNNQYSYTSIGISPSYETDNTVFVATAGDGVFVSSDRGQSWTLTNAGLGRLDIAKLSVSREYSSDSRVLAAGGSGGIWRRSNDDPAWQMVLAENIEITDFSEQPAAGEGVVVFAGDSHGQIWRSGDNGTSWQVIYKLPGEVAITSIATSGETIFAGTRKEGLFRSDDSGVSFRKVSTFVSTRVADCRGHALGEPVADRYITSVTFAGDDADQRKILVTTWYDGVFVSEDNGENWSKWGDGLSCDQQGDDMSEAHFRGVVTTASGSGQSIYWLGAFDGLFRSTAVGSSWQQLETLPLGLIKGMAVTGGSNAPLTIALATYGGGFYLTADRGLTWTIGNKGLETTRLTGLSFSPDYDNDGVIYGGASRRLLRSADRGNSWQRIDLQPPSFARRVLNKLNRWGISTSWFDSSDTAETRQVYPTLIVQSPDSGGNRVLFATRFDGVMGYDYEREDIVSLWSGTDRIMNSLEMSPYFLTDRTLFASIRNEGLIRSEDGGNNWTAVNNGLDFTARWTNSQEVGDFRRDIVIRISPNFGEDDTVFAGSPAGDGLYVSSDRGDSWSRLRVGSEQLTAPVLGIALSPEFATDRTMMVSIKGQGNFRSVNGGRDFDLVGVRLVEENASIEWLEYSPGFANDRTVIAASDEQLFLSEDGGDTWSQAARPVRYEDMRDVITYGGHWDRHTDEGFSAMTETSTVDEKGKARLKFVGGGVRWLGSCGTGHGSAQVFIDGESVATVRCGDRPTAKMQELFVASDLDYGSHTIEIRAISSASGEADGIVSVDAFDILPARVPAN